MRRKVLRLMKTMGSDSMGGLTNMMNGRMSLTPLFKDTILSVSTTSKLAKTSLLTTMWLMI